MPPRRALTSMQPRGFTLIEILVALVIVSIALVAGTQASTALSRGAQRQTDTLLAQLCAENELSKIRLARQLPGVGDTSVTCEQVNRNLTVRLEVRPTPNPSFRRVDAQVQEEGQAILSVSTIVGRY